MRADLEDAEGGIAQVATESWPPSWPVEPGWPSEPGLRQAIPQPSLRPLRALLDRVGSWPLAFPIGVAILSRIYSSVLLFVVPAFQIPSLRPGLALPHLTGFTSPFVQWDSQWYLTIANTGYHAAAMQAGPAGGRHDFAFFPAWPTLLRGLESLGLPAAQLAAPLANLLFVAAAVAMYVVLERRFGMTAARWGLVLLAFSPSAYILSMGYSEPLFLLLLAGTLLARSAPLRAALAFCLAGTRISSVALAIGSGLRWLRDWRDWRALLTAVAIGAGFAAWWVFIWFLTGDLLGWFRGSAQWGHALGFAGIQQAIETVSTPRLGSLLFVGTILAASVALVRRDLELGVMCVVAVGLSLVGAPVESMPRHALVAFPAFAVLAARLGPRRSLWLAIGFAILQADYVVLSFLGTQPLAP
jgi:mannosyltransferase PIG-V